MCFIVIFVSLLSMTVACPAWTSPDGTDGQCKCGSDLYGIIHCTDNSLSVLYCYCLTQSKSNQTTVGKCTQMCRIDSHSCSLFNIVGNRSVSELNYEICGKQFYRTGQLCGECMDGYGPPVYSYSMVCAQCHKTMFWRNLFKYIAAAFGPLTLLYLACILFNISIASGVMTSYVLICQIYTIPEVMEIVIAPSTVPGLSIKILISFYSIWNLDIFRAVYSPFCLHPSLNTMHVIALNYLIAVYPILLIFLTYQIVNIYDHAKAVFMEMCTRISIDLSFRGSLINTFATFFVLSYIKILNTSFILLTPVYVHTTNGSKSLYLFKEGEILYFGRQHLPFAILAITMILVCNILPVVLLLVYPTKFFQSRVQNHTLKAFMDVFQGCYRHQPIDCRYFSAVHYIFRATVLLLLQISKDALFLPLTGLSFLALSSLVIIVKPYQPSRINFAEVFLYIISSLNYFSLFVSYFYVTLIKPKLSEFKPILTVPANIFIFTSTVYGLVLLTYVIVPKKLAKLCTDLGFKIKHCTRSVFSSN